ncbi:uncharacterized protein B0J16DRAFT_383804 [Fusarium flagelliforme]|uniref:uncharacterized protein n=1 Tax=Fusarium flagelliforme TaxID=2675880 RepID=UPI001E8E9119|nr:uncharacterized protein B0J16DRAFT_383804 [Fusarium flagelliforme]KAH7184749.1 hypothetical protein B0J16DRAFT_383804 [Fusarium flagelliforme]
MSLSTQRNGQTGFVQSLEYIFKRFRTTEPSDLRPSLDRYCEILKQDAQAGGGHPRHGTGGVIRFLMKNPFNESAVVGPYRDRFMKPENGVGIAMMPHCPVSFVEILFSGPMHEDYEFTAENPSWKSSGGGVHLGTHYATTDLRWIVENIYEAYFWPFWHGGWNFGKMIVFDFATELGAKVNFLRSGRYTDSTELKVLDNLVDAVSRIQSNIDNLHKDEAFQARYKSCEYHADFHKLYLESTLGIWFELCRAIAPLADKDYKTQCEERSQDFGPRRHRFVVDPAWDPRAEWLERELDKQIPLCVEEERCLPRYATPLQRVMRDNLKVVYRQVMAARAGGRAWYEIEDENEWYVTPEDVQKALQDRRL